MPHNHIQFNNHATNQDLISDTNFWITGSYSGTANYHINDKTRNLNNWYDRVVSLIMRADNRWQWDDNNKTDLPIATCDLVANQSDYTISADDFLKVLKVECYQSNGNSILLSPIDYNDLTTSRTAMSEYQKTAGTPNEYDKVGNSIILYPKPNYAYTNGLKVYFQRLATTFTVSDTTKTPGFAPNFHRLLSMGAAYDYCSVNLPNRAKTLEGLIAKMEEALVEFYSARQRDEKPNFRMRKEDYAPGAGELGGELSVDW